MITLAGSPQAVLDDYVMQAARAGIEHVTDAIFRGKTASFRENVRVRLARRREGVIEDEGDSVRIEHRSTAHFVFEDLRD